MSYDLHEIWKLMKQGKHFHNGFCSGKFEPRYIGTDHFSFFHKPCDEEAKIKAVLIDIKGKIVFNVLCELCKKADALKIVEKDGFYILYI